MTLNYNSNSTNTSEVIYHDNIYQHAFNVNQVAHAFSLGTTQRNGMIKDMLGHLIANTDNDLLLREHPDLLLINSRTALRDKFYIVCMEEGISCIYCKTVWKDGSEETETKEREFSVERLFRLLKNLEQIHAKR